MHAAEDSSNAERTLESGSRVSIYFFMGVRMLNWVGCVNEEGLEHVRPNTRNSPLHPNLFLLQTCWRLSLFLFHVCRLPGLLLLLNLYVAITRVRQRGNFARRAPSIHFDIPELIRLFEESNGSNDVNRVPC